MARLHEYQGKAILAANGFQIPRGREASTADEAVAVAKELATDKKSSGVVTKIQAWTTGRAGVSERPGCSAINTSHKTKHHAHRSEHRGELQPAGESPD